MIIREKGGLTPTYENGNFCSFKVHHGGVIDVRDGITFYTGGAIYFVDHVNIRNFTYQDLESLARQIGYFQWLEFWYRLHGQKDFFRINNGHEIISMFDAMQINNLINIYFYESFELPRRQDIEYENVTELVNDDEAFDEDEGIMGSEFEDSEDDQNCLPEKNSDITQMWQVFYEKNHDVIVRENNVDSDGWESDGDHGVDSKGFEFNEVNDMKLPQFKLGLTFPNADILKRAIRQYSIMEHRRVTLVKNDKTRVRAKCVDGCNWVLYARVKEDKVSFEIRTLHTEHTCQLSFFNEKLKSKWLGNRYLQMFRADHNLSKESFIQLVVSDLKMDVTKWHFYRARNHAFKVIEGSMKDQYSMLLDYCDEVLDKNPGSTIKLMCDCTEGKTKFLRIYMCLGACKRGFLEHCRSIIGLDGCFIKGIHKGQILSAIGVDPNNGIYPLAFAVVESECYSSWEWFLQLLAKDLMIEHSQQYTWMSDRQKGLIDAVKHVFGDTPHRFCLRHLYSNFSQKFKGLKLKQSIESAARSTTNTSFQRYMQEINETDKEAWDWLNKLKPEHWSRSHFSGNSKSDMLLNNGCESFNKAIKDARDKPIISLLEIVRRYIMKRIVTKFDDVKKWKNPVGPRTQKIIENNTKASFSCITDYCGEGRFDVRCDNFKQYVVNLSTMQCTCRRWELSGIPCSHAISCIRSRDMDVYLHVHPSILKTTYEALYSNYVRPINGPELWKPTKKGKIEMPDFKIQRGRPKKKRRPSAQEIQEKESNTQKLHRAGMVMKCSRCQIAGHNKTTCNQTPRASNNQEAPSSHNSISSAPSRRHQKKN